MNKRILFSFANSFFSIAAVCYSTGCVEAPPSPPSDARASSSPQRLLSNQNGKSQKTEAAKNGAANVASDESARQDNDSSERRFEIAPRDESFDEAARRNADLKQNLNWTFAGKPQRGWSIYEPLIRHLLDVENGSDAEFAASLARWQKSEGIEANGILDETALLAMIKKWQAHRVKRSDYPLSDAFLTAPATDFWDSARAPELRQVERETYAAYKKMAAAAIADKSLNLSSDSNGNLAASEKYLKIVSSLRTREHQEKLRRESPNSGRAGLAVNSPHFTGRALDLYVGGEDPVSTKDENRAVQVKTPAYNWLVKNAAKFGFKPYFYEPWHWEYAPDAARK